jgi:ribose 5-phosphate isomerase A
MASPDTAASLKRAAAVKALEFVQDGMKVGLGTGSTAEEFLELIGPRVRGGFRIIGVPTSERTAQKARALGIALGNLDDLAPLDVTIDGADEADRNLDLIKGGGGALLREKIVAISSRRMIVIADDSKLVAQLGRFPLPVEVIEFGHGTTLSRIRVALAELGYQNVTVALRMKDGAPVRSDNNNLIYDCKLNSIANATRLGSALSKIPGVVEHGLFVGIATTLLIAHPGEVEVIARG